MGNALASAYCSLVLHIFPSFGIGGVPLRMVRVINHFGKHFHHTVIALDNDYAAADSLAGDVDVMLPATQQQKRGTIRSVLAGALALRRMRPGLHSPARRTGRRDGCPVAAREKCRAPSPDIRGTGLLAPRAPAGCRRRD